VTLDLPRRQTWVPAAWNGLLPIIVAGAVDDHGAIWEHSVYSATNLPTSGTFPGTVFALDAWAPAVDVPIAVEGRADDYDAFSGTSSGK
jgi:hypothetical protein